MTEPEEEVLTPEGEELVPFTERAEDAIIEDDPAALEEVIRSVPPRLKPEFGRILYSILRVDYEARKVREIVKQYFKED